MRSLLIVLAAFAASCSPPTAPPAETPAETSAEAMSPRFLDFGPYTNSWDAAEFSRFRHRVRSPEPGEVVMRLEATTNSPGGETVAVYPIGPDGQPRTERIMFVIADGDGTSLDQAIEIPDDGMGVEVVVENAGGRRHAGSYTLSVLP
jgi:hypothetical protein